MAEMRQEALVFLESKWARQIVAAWACGAPTGESLRDIIDLAEFAGISSINEVAKLRKVLLKNGIIFTDGTVDPAAGQYIGNLAVKKLPKPPARK